jgi:hypothetical protein
MAMAIRSARIDEQRGRPDRAMSWLWLRRTSRNLGKNEPEHKKDSSASRTFQSAEGEEMRRMSRC